MPALTFPAFTPDDTTRKRIDDTTIAIYLPDNLGHIEFTKHEDHITQTTYEGGNNPLGEYDPHEHRSITLDNTTLDDAADTFHDDLQQIIDNPDLFHAHFGRPF